jgi:hypothetical protein
MKIRIKNSNYFSSVFSIPREVSKSSRDMEASIFSMAAFSSAMLVIWDGVSSEVGEVTPFSVVAVEVVELGVGETRGTMRITPDVALSLLSFVDVDVDVASSLSLSSRSVGSARSGTVTVVASC